MTVGSACVDRNTQDHILHVYYYNFMHLYILHESVFEAFQSDGHNHSLYMKIWSIYLVTAYLCRPDIFERYLNLVLKLLKLFHAKWAQVLTKKISVATN